MQGVPFGVSPKKGHTLLGAYVLNGVGIHKNRRDLRLSLGYIRVL